ncbi:MAG: hypothetical protein ACOY3P_04770 [Planctomycetota bacterium]
MLIPQFTIRWMLGLTAVAAVFFSIVALATRGHYWAVGVSAAVGTLVVLMLVYAAFFCFVSIAAPLTRVMAPSLGSRSPFRKGDLPVTTEKDVPAAPILLNDPPEAASERALGGLHSESANPSPIGSATQESSEDGKPLHP